MKRSFLLGIGGGTAGGKSTFARLLREHGSSKKVSVVLLDSYYYCRAHLDPTERAQANYDHPDAFEFSLVVDHLNRLREGNTITPPIYDYATHSRTSEVQVIDPTPLVIVEGILTLHDPKLRELFDLKVFVDAPERVRFERRAARDQAQRGRTLESVERQWRETVAPMHQQFCAPTKVLADVAISGEVITPEIVARFWQEQIEPRLTA